MASSYCRVDRDAVVIRHWPWRERRVPLPQVDRFDVTRKTSGRAVYDCLVLLLIDGSTVATGQRQLADSDHDEAQVEALRLNNELAKLRG